MSLSNHELDYLSSPNVGARYHATSKYSTERYPPTESQHTAQRPTIIPGSTNYPSGLLDSLSSWDVTCCQVQDNGRPLASK